MEKIIDYRAEEEKQQAKCEANKRKQERIAKLPKSLQANVATAGSLINSNSPNSFTFNCCLSYPTCVPGR